MTTSTAVRPAVRAAFAALVDYAGLFPPAKLTLDEARREYREAQQGPHAWMLGRFIIPASLLATNGFEETLSAIVEPNAEALRAVAAVRERGVKVAALEIPLGQSLTPFREHLSRDEILDVLGALEEDLGVTNLRDLPAFVEIPRTAPWSGMLVETMAVLARLRLGAKIRCGGVTAEAFPSVEEVAQFIASACHAAVPFKATAGLHHPVRHVDAATGFTMHGFLNVLGASALAPRVPPETLRSIVAEEDPSAFAFDDETFAWRDERVAQDDIELTRRNAFVAYGSCSFGEPVQDLGELGVLPPQ
jgi:hypothetical protein